MFMKIVTLVLLAMGLSLGAWAQSQDQSGSQSGSQSGQSQAQNSQTSTSNNNQNMSGTVSHDRKTLMNDKDSKNYKVDNPNSLQGKEDQHVSMIVAVDPDTNTIHVIQLEAPPQ
jgi:anionic cell wall polymer biosynthesis LytR-Cps2A-Psr (LCP) family protein